MCHAFAVTAFTDYIKSLSPSAVDMELRMLQVIDHVDLPEADKRPELYYIELLLDYFVHETSCRNNFEFIQALIRLFLKVSYILQFFFQTFIGLHFYASPCWQQRIHFGIGFLEVSLHEIFFGSSYDFSYYDTARFMVKQFDASQSYRRKQKSF